jgi:hypothetical protein
MKQTFNKLFHSFIAVIFGAAIWLYFWKESGGHDPQEGDSYWTIGYPIMLVGSTLFGYLFQERPWKYGVYIIGTQLFIGFFIISGDLNMLPIGLIVQVIIAIPLIAGGYLGAWLFKRSQKHKHPTSH